ncbi:MAG TPA: PepSY domain-containing protein [Hyphomonadaceae bacterium]|nr:PepSY domain-containing protein [Hyphomonadaceae bacterium]
MNARLVETRETEGRGALYRMLWRWHFYAGLVCIPFVIWLAVTGSIYLFRPQIEAWIDRDLVALERTGQPATQKAIMAAATAAVPGSTLAGIVLPEHPDQAARVLVSNHGARTRVYVHPDTLAILKTVDEQGRFERIVFRLHGELMMGNGGSILVELAASWAVVMILTGLYLWWPRNAKGLGGVLYPRLGQGARRFWRDLHAVTGIWVSAFALFLLSTGLPWALVWGNGFKMVRQWTGTAAISQDWSIGASNEHAEHAGHASGMVDHSVHGGVGIDDIVARAIALRLAPPVMLTPPSEDSPVWWARSNAQNRPLREDVALDAMTGKIIDRDVFGEKHIIDQIVGFGIAAHEGQLFAPLNQILGVLTAAGLITLCVSAFVMWRRRAPEGVLGAPPPIPDERIGLGLAAIILVAAILLPVLGASLVVLALVERGVLARWPSARRWLGLAAV